MDALQLLAADVADLEQENERLTRDVEVLRTMVSELLELTHQSLVRILTLSERRS